VCSPVSAVRVGDRQKRRPEHDFSAARHRQVGASRRMSSAARCSTYSSCSSTSERWYSSS
jgi:hypothetical protein